MRDRRHLARVVRVIRRMPDVSRVTRTIAAHARDEHSGDDHAADSDGDMDDTDASDGGDAEG